MYLHDNIDIFHIGVIFKEKVIPQYIYDEKPFPNHTISIIGCYQCPGGVSESEPDF